MNENPPSKSEESRLGPLATTIEELATRQPDAISSYVREVDLRGLVDLALRLTLRARSELVLHAPQPMALLRALPAAEVYMMIREIGPHDALPLLSLASSNQLVHLFDLESWRGDRFDADRAGAWVAVFLESGESTLRRFLRAADDETLAVLIHGWLRLEPFDDEDDAGEGGPMEDEAGTVLAPDGRHRLDPDRAEHLQAARRTAEMLFAEQPARWRWLTGAISVQLPSEMEEEALRWRQSRLEEFGYPPLDEALAIYAPSMSPPAPVASADADPWPASREPLLADGAESWLAEALARMTDNGRLATLRQFVAIGNRVLVADGADTGDPQAHRTAMEKAVGAVRIALEARGAADSFVGARALETVPLIDLFREGHARVVDIQRRAFSLAREGWLRRHERAAELLEPVLGARVRALLERQPLHAEILPDGRAHRRPFRRLAEIEEARAAVELSEAIGRVLVEGLGLDLARLLGSRSVDGAAEPPRFDAYFLTLLAWHSLRGEVCCDPLPLPLARQFVDGTPPNGDRNDRQPQLDAFIEALCGRFELSPRERSLLMAFGRACTERLQRLGAGSASTSGAGPELGGLFVLAT